MTDFLDPTTCQLCGQKTERRKVFREETSEGTVTRYEYKCPDGHALKSTVFFPRVDYARHLPKV